MFSNMMDSMSITSLLMLSIEIALLLSCLICIKKKTLKFSFASMAGLALLWQLNFTNNGFTQAFQHLEALRYCVFILTLLYMLIDARRASIPIYWLTLTYTITFFLSANLILNNSNLQSLPIGLSVWLYGKIIFCVIVIVIAEQLLRQVDSCRIAKFSALIIITQVSYDTLVNCNLLLHIIDNELLWQARSFINTATSLLLTLAIIITPFETHQQNKFQLSNPLILFNGSLILGGVFLIFISFFSITVQYYQLPWAELLSIVFYVLALLSIATLSCMKKFRRKVNVWISKHLFDRQYDYHQQWIALDLLLSQESSTKNSHDIALQAMIKLFNCDAGALWVKGPQFFTLCSTHKITLDHAHSIEESSNDFIKKMHQDEWIFQSPEHTSAEDKATNLLLPAWFIEHQDSWSIVPLHYQKSLIGFILLCREENSSPLTWEDLNILKLTGRQIASYLQRQHNAEKLLENRKFDLFNQVTAFAIHDIKNLVAQQKLMVKNAEKFKDSPEFIDDMIFTLANSVKKMDNLLIKLRGNNTGKMESVDVEALIRCALKMNKQAKPTPTLSVTAEQAFVHADFDKLLMAVNHLLQNSFDATEETGTITISLSIKKEKLWIEISDTGCGMEKEFVDNILFKPFSSSKKNQGMGLGAYQVKTLINSLCGEIFVESTKNHGTTFFIYLPLEKR